MSSAAAHQDPDTETLICHSHSSAETDAMGAVLAGGLRAGDTLCLSGPLGAGKSQLARAILRTALGDDRAEVPSPSYTLVNVYDTRIGEIWHADLYRIGEIDELEEIGLADATGRAIVLVEWPERWVPRPARRLEVMITPLDGDNRSLSFSAFGGGWDRLLAALR